MVQMPATGPSAETQFPVGILIGIDVIHRSHRDDDELAPLNEIDFPLLLQTLQGSLNRAKRLLEINRNVCGGAVNHAIEVGMVFDSYPSRVVWADIGPSMSKQKFPLAPAESYKVHFDAYLRSPDGHVMFLQSQQLYETWPGHDTEFQLYITELNLFCRSGITCNERQQVAVLRMISRTIGY
jgi:hypothetical protein